ncbi:MAG TPA: HD domain-containing phosphohydrolase [Lachnospiraceae bacterium]|nr:HD domain-containing phosphohydrolase [Lachnospiraceae bacterium]
MRRITAKQLIPGMIVAEDIFSFSDQLLIPKGTVLTDSAITILEMYDIISIRVDDTPIADSTPDLTVPLSVRTKSSAEFKTFKKKYDLEVDRFKQSLSQAMEKKLPLDIDELLDGTLDLLGNVHSFTGVVDILQCMREYDDLTYAHSINVAFICNVAARWLNMPENDIRMATSCGLFHDIGKVQIPKIILNKPSKLTIDEFAIIKKHPVTGYQLLREQSINDHICNAALMHHERCDGTGYPFGIKDIQIDRFAKLVAIADVYDAMTAARVYRGPLCPFTVIDLFEKEGLQQYDPRYIMTFLENIVNTYVSNRCRLSNGQEGDIIYINKERLSRPMIQCGKEYINLSERTDLSIECLI